MDDSSPLHATVHPISLRYIRRQPAPLPLFFLTSQPTFEPQVLLLTLRSSIRCYQLILSFNNKSTNANPLPPHPTPPKPTNSNPSKMRYTITAVAAFAGLVAAAPGGYDSYPVSSPPAPVYPVSTPVYPVYPVSTPVYPVSKPVQTPCSESVPGYPTKPTSVPGYPMSKPSVPVYSVPVYSVPSKPSSVPSYPVSKASMPVYGASSVPSKPYTCPAPVTVTVTVPYATGPAKSSSGPAKSSGAPYPVVVPSGTKPVASGYPTATG